MRAGDRDDDLTDQLLDLIVYAPLGLALEARELLPKLAERGRGQVALTRLAGAVAARQGRQEAERLVGDVRSSIGALFGFADSSAPTADPQPDEGLPIPGYASMTAVDIIARLADLDDEQLDAVERFERANRARVTVLTRIAQRRER